MRKFEGIKKVELNCHLDGSLDLNLASKWSNIPVADLKKKLTKYQGIKNLSEYLQKFELPLELLQTTKHLSEAAYTLLETMRLENVIYAEIRIAPLLHTQEGLSLEDIVSATLGGMKKSKLKSNLILTMKREHDTISNKKVIDIAKKYLNKGVCAVDLAGDESIFPTNIFEELFDYAKTKNVPFTISSGETGTYKDIDIAIKYGAKRIGYGVSAIKNYKTMETLKKKQIPLEICLSSNIDTGTFTNYESHPIGRLIDSGVLVTINTDNRTLSKTDLSHEYYLLSKHFGYTKDDFYKMNKIALEHSFLNEEDKNKLLSELTII